MPSPFPGMDPYLEQPAIWSDYHSTFLMDLRAAINDRLPDRYVARVDRYVWIQEPDEEESRLLGEPDVFVTDESESTASAVIAIEAPAMGKMPFQHIGILSLEFHVDKLSRPLL